MFAKINVLKKCTYCQNPLVEAAADLSLRQFFVSCVRFRHTRQKDCRRRRCGPRLPLPGSILGITMYTGGDTGGGPYIAV